MSKDFPTIVEVSAHYPPHVGGLEAVVELLADGLAQRGAEVRVVTGDGPGTQNASPSLFAVVRHRSANIGGLPLIPGMAVDLVRSPRRSVFHVHLSQAGLPELALVIGRIRRIPVVLHFHLDVQPSGRFGRIFALYKAHVLPRSLRAAAKVVVFSERQSRDLQWRYKIASERLAVIPNGVRPMDGALRSHDYQAPLCVLFVGRLTQQKRVETLLEAVALIGDDLSIHVEIVGTGPRRDDLGALAKRLRLDCVRFAGHLTGRQLEAAYRWADVFVLPSEGEGMPLALLEAMSAGLVAVGSDVIGIADFIDDGVNGVLFSEGNPVHLAIVLAALSNDGERCRQLAERARLSAASLTWEATVEQLCSVLLEVTRRPIH